MRRTTTLCGKGDGYVGVDEVGDVMGEVFDEGYEVEGKEVVRGDGGAE